MSMMDVAIAQSVAWDSMICFIEETWPALLMTWLVCPVECSPRVGSLFGLIQHLNDDHRWTREQIASYLDTLADVDLSV